MPLPTSVQPVLPEFDHALRLYPMPTAVSALPICYELDSLDCRLFWPINMNAIVKLMKLAMCSTQVVSSETLLVSQRIYRRSVSQKNGEDFI